MKKLIEEITIEKGFITQTLRSSKMQNTVLTNSD
jgi:hypothetical protein